MKNTRHANGHWDLGEQITWDKVPIAVLMDIRDELQKLNHLLHCGNFLAIPKVLRDIRGNTAKKKPKARAKRGKG